MNEMHFKGKINRRSFLRAGMVGACTLGLAGFHSLTSSSVSSAARKGFINPVRSKWFTGNDQNQLSCLLCPKACTLDVGERAPCGVRENRNGKGYTLAYGNPALIQEDPVERKPFFHVLPGKRALSISTAGCNLECDFCEVWDMALVKPEEVYAYDLPPERVIAHAKEADVKAISYAFGEPVIFYEYMQDISRLAREANLLNLMHTAGYIQPDPLNEIIDQLDAVNIDLKSFEPEFYRQVVGGELEPVLKTLQRIKEAGVHIEITSIIIPTLNDDQEMIREMCQWIVDELGEGVPIHFARFYPLYRLSSLPRTPVFTLEQARNTALKAGLQFVYLSRVTGHEAENTFCPGCQKVVIDRKGFIIDELNLSQGKCKFCGTEIPGRWT